MGSTSSGSHEQNPTLQELATLDPTLTPRLAARDSAARLLEEFPARFSPREVQDELDKHLE